MPPELSVTRDELVWLRDRIDELETEYMLNGYDESEARRLAKQQAWNEMASSQQPAEAGVGVGPPSKEEIAGVGLQDQAFLGGKNIMSRWERRQQAATIGSAKPTSYDIPQEGSVDPVIRTYPRGWESPFQLIKGMIGERDPGAPGAVQPRSLGFPYSMGLGPHTGSPAAGAFSFDNPAAEFTANFFWRFYDSFTLGIGPAIQKAIERKTGWEKVYPDWADSPQSIAGRIGATAGGAIGLFAPELLTGGLAPHLEAKVGVTAAELLTKGLGKKAFAIGGRVAQKGLQAGIKKAGFETTEQLIKKAAPKIVKGIKKVSPKWAKEFGEKEIERLAYGLIGKAAKVQRDVIVGSPEAAIASLRQGSGVKFAGSFANTIKKRIFEFTDDAIRHYKLPSEAAEVARMELRRFGRQKAYDSLVDFGTGKVSRALLAAADHGIASGISMALHSTAHTVAQLAGEGAPVGMIAETAGKQALSSVQTGMIFGAIGMIPNIQSMRHSQHGTGVVLRAMGWKDKAIKAFQKKWKELGPKWMAEIDDIDHIGIHKFRAKFWKLPDMKKMMGDPEGRVRINVMGKVLGNLIRNDTARREWVEQFPLIMRGAWNMSDDAVVKGLVEEMNTMQAMLRRELFWRGMRETGKQFVAAFPRMATGAFIMNWRELATDRDQIAEHPEDFISSVLMGMYFTRHPNIPYIPSELAAKPGITRYIDPRIDSVKQMLRVHGQFFPDIYRDQKMYHHIINYTEGITSLMDVSQKKYVRHKLAVVKNAKRTAKMPSARTIEENIVEVPDGEKARVKIRKLTPEQVLKEELTTKGKRALVVKTLTFLNESLGPRARKGEKLIDIASLTDAEILAIHDALARDMGVNEVRPWEIQDEVRKLSHDIETRKGHDIITTFVTGVRNQFPFDMGKGNKGFIRELVLDPSIKDHQLEMMIQAYNEYAYLTVREGLLLGEGSQRVPVDPEKRGKADVYYPQPGELRLEPVRITPEMYRAYKAQEAGNLLKNVADIYTESARQWGEWVGDKDAHHFGDHRTMMYLQNKAVRGSFDRAIRVHQQGGKLRLTEPIKLSDAQGNPYELWEVGSEEIFARLLMGGFYDPKGKALRQLPPWEDLKDKPLWLGPSDSPEYYRTAQGRYEILRAYLEVLPFITNYKNFADVEGNMKRSFDGQEPQGAHQLIEILQRSGLALSRKYVSTIRTEAIRRKYEKLNHFQTAMLESLEEMKLFDWGTSIVKMPVLVDEVTNAAGETFLQLKKNVADLQYGMELHNELFTLHRLGVIKDIEFIGGDVKINDIFGLKGGAYIKGQEAMNRLVSVFKARAAGVGYGRSPEHIVNRIIKELDVADLSADKKPLRELLNQNIAKLAFAHTRSSYYKLMRFLEAADVIKIPKPGEPYVISKLENILKRPTIEIIEGMVTAELGIKPETMAAQVMREVEDLAANLRSGRLLEVQEARRVPLVSFFENLGISSGDYIHQVMYDAIRQGKVNSGAELRDFLEGVFQPWNADAKKFKGQLKDRDWQGIYAQVLRQRLVDLITINHATQFETSEDGTIQNIHGDVGLKVTQQLVSGNETVDALLADGLKLTIIANEVLTGGIQKKGKSPFFSYETMDLMENPNEAVKHLNNILEASNTRGDKRKLALFQKRGADGKKKYNALKELGVIVPIGPGSPDQHNAVTMPVPGTEGYKNFYNAMKTVQTTLHGIKAKMAEEQKNKEFDWTEYKQSHIHLAARAVDSLMKNLTAPGKVPKEMISFAELGVPHGDLSRAVHAYIINKRFGTQFWEKLHSSIKGAVRGEFEEMNDLKKRLGKRAKLETNVSAESVDKRSFQSIADMHNRLVMRGPKLVGTHFRAMIVDDSAEFKDIPGEFLNGMISMSQRAAYAVSFAYGSRKPHPIFKGFFLSGQANAPGVMGMQHLLTKNSFQVIESYQKFHENLGVDFIIPRSALKWWTDAVVGQQLTMKELSTGRPKKGRTRVRILEIPIDHLKLIQFTDDGPIRGNLTHGMELHLGDPALEYFKEHFTSRVDRGIGTPGMKQLGAYMGLLSMARDGNRYAILKANQKFREFYLQSEQVGRYEPPGYPSSHKEWIFSHPLANPMDPAWRERSLNFIKNRVMRDQIFKTPNVYGRKATLQPSYRDNDPAWELLGPEQNDGIGTMLGSPFDRSLKLHYRTQAGFKDSKGKMKRMRLSPKFFKTMLDNWGGDNVSKFFKQLLVQNKVDPKNNAQVGEFLYNWLKGQSPNHVMTYTEPWSEGRFYELLDWVYAGGKFDSARAVVKETGFDYGVGINKRPKGMQVGIITMVQGWPGIKGNDTMVLLKTGLLPRMHGNVAMLNRYDAVVRAERDWDWDSVNYFNDMTEGLVHELVGRSRDAARLKPLMDADPHRAKIPLDLDPTSLSSWVQHKHHSYVAQQNIGKATNVGQAIHLFTQGQRFLRLKDPETGKWFFVGPRFRDYKDMRKKEKHLEMTKAIQTFTDAEGSRLSDYYMNDNRWKWDLYREMFAIFPAKEGNPEVPDFTKPLDYTSPDGAVRLRQPNDAVFMEIIDVMTSPYKRLSRVLSADSKSKFSYTMTEIGNYNTRMWGLKGSFENPKGSINNYIVQRLMNNAEALSYVVSALGADAADIKKIFKYKELAMVPSKKGEWRETINRIKSRIHNAAKAEATLLRSMNVGYKSVRETMAEQINLAYGKYRRGEKAEMDKAEYDGLRMVADMMGMLSGLPAQADIKALENAFYAWYKNEAVAYTDDLSNTQAQLREELRTQTLSERQQARLRAQIKGIGRVLNDRDSIVRRGETRDKREHFLLNPTGAYGEKKVTRYDSDGDVIDAFVESKAVHSTLASLGPDPEQGQIRYEARELRKEISNAWRLARTMGRGVLRFDERSSNNDYQPVEVTTEMVNEFQRVRIQQYLGRWAEAGKGDRAALSLLVDAPDDILGWWKVSRKGATPAYVPVQRTPLRAVYSHIRGPLMAKIALTQGVLRNALSGSDINAFMATVAADMHNYGALIGREPSTWEIGPKDPMRRRLHWLTKKQYVKQGTGDPMEVEHGSVAEMEAYDPHQPVVIKLSSTNLAVLTGEEFINILNKAPVAQNVTMPVAVTYLQRAQMQGGVLDMTNAGRDNPIRRIASFILKEQQRLLPDHHWEDVRLMGGWLKHSMSPTNTGLYQSADYVMRVEESGVPAAKAKELIQSNNAVRAGLGRLITEIHRDTLVKGHRGEPVDLETWAARILWKDLDYDKMTKQDVGKLRMEWERMKTRAKKAGPDKYGGIFWAIKDKFFPTSATLEAREETIEAAKVHVREQFALGQRQVELSKAINRASKELDDVIRNSGMTPQSKKFAEREGRLSYELARANKVLARIKVKTNGVLDMNDPDTRKWVQKRDTVLAELEQLQKSGMPGASDIYKLQEDIWEVATSIDDLVRDSDGNVIDIKWIKGRQEIVDKIIGSAKVPGARAEVKDQILQFSKTLYQFFEALFPVLQEGMPAYKELLTIRLRDEGLANDIVKQISDAMQLKRKKGYLPNYHYNILSDLMLLTGDTYITGDRTSFLNNLLSAGETGVIPHGTGEIKHRTGREGWSRNILLAMTRYADDVSTFVYRNKVELGVTHAVAKLNRVLASGHFDKPKFKKQVDTLLEYMDNWKADILDVPERRDFMSSVAQYVRGVQLISKLGMRLSTPVRNVTQLWAHMAVVGMRTTFEAHEAAKSDTEFQKFLGTYFAPGGIGDMEFMTTQEKLRSLKTGLPTPQTRGREFFRKFTSKMLWPLQNLPYVGEHAVRKLAWETAMYMTWRQFKGNEWLKTRFRKRSFSKAMLEAHPELKEYTQTDSMGNKVEQTQWEQHVWGKRYNEFMRKIGSDYASDLISLVHFDYSEGSRAPIMRTPLGSVLFQLRHFTFKNAEMWYKFLGEARRSKAVSNSWGEWMQTKEFRTMAKLGAFTMGTHAMTAFIPLGVGWLFRPDWMDFIGQGMSAAMAYKDDDVEKINRLFYRKGVFQMAFGPAVSELTTFTNIMFANYIGDPDNAVKLLAGLRDMRQMDDGELLHKVARAVGPAVVADIFRYDIPKYRQTSGRSLPESFFGALGLRYRYDEGQSVDALNNWITGIAGEITGKGRQPYGEGFK